MNTSSLYIIILNYNHLDDLKETLASFKLQDYHDKHLVVSDNGSTDDSLFWLKENHPDVKILENRANLGWAEGNNRGIRFAMEQRADYILLANNDLSFVNPKLISNLIKQLNEKSRLIIGPKQNYYYKPDTLFSEGHFFMNITCKSFNSLRLKYIETANHPSNQQVVDYVAGSFVLFPSKLVDEIGLIDRRFYLYGEDADFFLRAWKKGYVSVVDKNETILHKVSATALTGSPLKKYYQNRNIWLNFQKHNDIGQEIRFFKIHVLKSVIKTLLVDLKHFRFKHMSATVLGLWHGIIIKKFGKYY